MKYNVKKIYYILTGIHRLITGEDIFKEEIKSYIENEVILKIQELKYLHLKDKIS
jgi:hypothetical protein